MIKKWTEDLNRHFSKEDTQIPTGTRKKLHANHGEIQIKTTVRLLLIPVRMALIKDITSVGEDVEEENHFTLLM